MASDSIGLIIALFVLVLLSGCFSASETAFSSANRIRLKSMALDGNKKAKKALLVLDKYDSILSTILIGNNIVNISAASIATLIFVRAMGEKGATVATLVTTVVVLIFGEVTPKSLAKESPEKFAMSTAGVFNILIKIFTPLNYLFTLWNKLIKKVFKLESDTSITEGEFLTMVDEAESDGGIDKQDSELIKNVIEFNDLDADEVLTPRAFLVAVSIDAKNNEIKEAFVENEYSRIPVFEDDIDNIVGFIHQRDFYTYVLSGNKNLSEIINPVIYVSPTMKISNILALLQQKHIHMAVVTDEFGGTDGIITMEDILEELVGEIYDEHDEVIEEFKRTGDNEYLILCTADLEDMFDFFKLKVDSDEEFESNTVSGWVLEQLGRIPVLGDSFDYENLHVVVTQTDSRRVIEIKVVVQKADVKTEEE